jgi:hypothetical protein
MSNLSREESSFMQKINDLQDEFYLTHKKNTFFKSTQKKDLALKIINNMSLTEILNVGAYNIPNTNKVYIDYTILKSCTIEETYQAIIEHIFRLFRECIEKYNNYECHISLLSYSMTACERHKGIFKYLTDECDKRKDYYTLNITNFYIYNTPSIMSKVFQIVSPIMHESLKTKIVMFNKIESSEKIIELHQTV